MNALYTPELISLSLSIGVKRTKSLTKKSRAMGGFTMKIAITWL